MLAWRRAPAPPSSSGQAGPAASEGSFTAASSPSFRYQSPSSFSARRLSASENSFRGRAQPRISAEGGTQSAGQVSFSGSGACVAPGSPSPSTSNSRLHVLPCMPPLRVQSDFGMPIEAVAQMALGFSGRHESAAASTRTGTDRDEEEADVDNDLRGLMERRHSYSPQVAARHVPSSSVGGAAGTGAARVSGSGGVSASGGGSVGGTSLRVCDDEDFMRRLQQAQRSSFRTGRTSHASGHVPGASEPSSGGGLQNQTHAALEQLRVELKASSMRILRASSMTGRPADMPAGAMSPSRLGSSSSRTAVFHSIFHARSGSSVAPDAPGPEPVDGLAGHAAE